jgi:hypothetical protein
VRTGHSISANLGAAMAYLAASDVRERLKKALLHYKPNETRLPGFSLQIYHSLVKLLNKSCESGRLDKIALYGVPHLRPGPHYRKRKTTSLSPTTPTTPL